VEELKNKIKDLTVKIEQAIKIVKLDDKQKTLDQLKQLMSDPDFWQDKNKAQEISTQYNVLHDLIEAWHDLSGQIFDLQALLDDEQFEDLLPDISEQLESIELKYDNLATQLFLTGKYDQSSAIITINAGAGGDDAQDWAMMLERMYLRFVEDNNWKVSILSRSSGAIAGIKSVTFKVEGAYVYGYLKTEAGVHRLVRLSPFDADHARHTSFAMVEVLPELQKVEIDIKSEDLRIDTYRASGHGGQSVNTTDSAVRITHLPTNLTASCQNERSQLQNKNQALIHLQSKLARYYEAVKDEEKQLLRGEYTAAAWGNQIRSYVLHPYKLVKDHRTKFEVNNPEQVLDGQLMPFIKSRLEDLVS
jgi:peptide chain release factor 2